MKFLEVSQKLAKILEQEELTKDKIINIRNQAVDPKYNIYPEDITEEDQVRAINIAGNQVYTIDHIDDIYLCTLDVFKDIISNLVSNFINTIPDGFDKYFNRDALEADCLADKITLQQLCEYLHEDTIEDFEEVNYNNEIYIVMEL